MNKVYTLLLLLIFLATSCRSIKKYTDRGDYEKAVDYAIAKLDNDKVLKTDDVKHLEKAYRWLESNVTEEVRFKILDPQFKYRSIYKDIKKLSRVQDKLNTYFPIISKDGYEAKFEFASVGKLQENAFKNITRNDLVSISNQIAENRYLDAYYSYVNIQRRQNFISTTPAVVGVDGYVPTFVFEDIVEDMSITKSKALEIEYEKAILEFEKFADTGKKKYPRNALSILKTIERIDTNYRDIHRLMLDAEDFATVHILLDIDNRTMFMLPFSFESDILRRSFGHLDRSWVKYYKNRNARSHFDVVSILEINDLDISPDLEEVANKRLTKKIKDGWEYVLDKKGNVAKDSLGNDIKKDKYIDVKGKFSTITMKKFASLSARVIYHNTITKATTESRLIDVRSDFTDVFYRFKGDERVLEREEKRCLKKGMPSYPDDDDLLDVVKDELRKKFERELSRNVAYDHWFNSY